MILVGLGLGCFVERVDPYSVAMNRGFDELLISEGVVFIEMFFSNS
jgi:hypothetical protein